MLNRRRLIKTAAAGLLVPAMPAIISRALAASHGKTPSPGDIVYPGIQGPRSGLAFDFATHGRLKVDSSGRFLTANDGTYFPWVADTSWDLVDAASSDQAASLMENRRAQGYTTLQVMACGLATYPAVTGAAFPFTGSNLSNPDNTWFNNVDSLVSVAAGKGLVIALWGIWALNYGVFSNPYITQFSSGQATNFGTFLGNRYGSATNVVFGNGGDYAPPASGATATNYNALGAALKAAAPNTLITCHCGTSGASGYNSASDFQSQSWLDFSGSQTSQWSLNNADAINVSTTGYNASPTKPTTNLESAYENSPINFNSANGFFSTFDSRQQMWWSSDGRRDGRDLR